MCTTILILLFTETEGPPRPILKSPPARGNLIQSSDFPLPRATKITEMQPKPRDFTTFSSNPPRGPWDNTCRPFPLAFFVRQCVTHAVGERRLPHVDRYQGPDVDLHLR